jgi:hypothetical protein
VESGARVTSAISCFIPLRSERQGLAIERGQRAHGGGGNGGAFAARGERIGASDVSSVHSSAIRRGGGAAGPYGMVRDGEEQCQTARGS